MYEYIRFNLRKKKTESAVKKKEKLAKKNNIVYI